jgi:hypothetical protein
LEYFTCGFASWPVKSDIVGDAPGSAAGQAPGFAIFMVVDPFAPAARREANCNPLLFCHYCSAISAEIINPECKGFPDSME